MNLLLGLVIHCNLAYLRSSMCLALFGHSDSPIVLPTCVGIRAIALYCSVYFLSIRKKDMVCFQDVGSSPIWSVPFFCCRLKLLPGLDVFQTTLIFAVMGVTAFSGLQLGTRVSRRQPVVIVCTCNYYDCGISYGFHFFFATDICVSTPSMVHEREGW